MSRVRIGVIGAGLIAQIEHIPNLLRLRDKFAVAGVCDPSPASREFVRQHFEHSGSSIVPISYSKHRSMPS